jgi:hypothetical protein
MKSCIKHVIAINAATRNLLYKDMQEKINTFKCMSESELEEQLGYLKNILKLVTTRPRLKEPQKENLDIIEYLKTKYVRSDHNGTAKMPTNG